MVSAIRTDRMFSMMRPRVMDADHRRVLVARMEGSKQAKDLTLPPNVEGLGRKRHFKMATASGWPDNPLPIHPASKWLGIEPPDGMQAQVFQLAGCAWRCWYCFVPFDLLSADTSKAEWMDPARLVELYLNEPDMPPILDLSGGSPDLVPEWIGWTMDAIEELGSKERVYLWSDDNLSSDLLLRQESRHLLERIESYGLGYGKVCCLKGFDGLSFAFNTGAEEGGFEEQLRILEGYSRTSLDLHLYVTLTAPERETNGDAVKLLVRRLGEIRADLPGRTVPLLVTEFTSMRHRVDPTRLAALSYQWKIVRMWHDAIRSQGLEPS